MGDSDKKTDRKCFAPSPRGGAEFIHHAAFGGTVVFFIYYLHAVLNTEFGMIRALLSFTKKFLCLLSPRLTRASGLGYSSRIRVNRFLFQTGVIFCADCNLFS